MGMDLIPNNKSVEPIHFNWTGWRALLDFLQRNGCPMGEFSGSNDGDRISKATCERVAEIIRNKFMDMPDVYRAYIQKEEAQGIQFGGDQPSDTELKEILLADVPFWEDCGGCQQW